MKKILGICVLILISTMLLFGCNDRVDKYLRIHIRANSNIEIDQNIKYKIKDKVVEYLTPIVCDCSSFEDVKNMIGKYSNDIKNICDTVLSSNGFTYKSSVEISNEYFPTRAYGEYVLESDFYDALIINLGNGTGDNWWCVVYPPLCFLSAKEINLSTIKYKSKLVEIINNFFD